MFNLSGSEIVAILLLALVVLGPDKLPDAVRRAGRFYAQVKKMGDTFQSEMRSALDEPMKEMRDTADLLRSATDFTAPTTPAAPRPAATTAEQPPAPAAPSPAAASDEGAAEPVASGASGAGGEREALIRRTLSGSDGRRPGQASDARGGVEDAPGEAATA